MKKITQVGDEFVKSLFPPKKSDSNKGSYGTLLIIGGSARYSGAPLLASLGAAALTTGCGIATLAVPDFLLPAMWQRVTHCTLYPLKSNNGFILLDTSQINDVCNKPTAVIFGMGIDENLQDEVMITIIATGFEPQAENKNLYSSPRPMFSQPKSNPHVNSMYGFSPDSAVRDDKVHASREVAADEIPPLRQESADNRSIPPFLQRLKDKR